MKTENVTQHFALAEHITPSPARAAGSYVSAAIQASKFQRLVAALQVGTLVAAATVNGRWQHCSGSASSLAAWADIDGTNCITSTFASTSNDKIAELELRLDQNPTVSPYVRFLASAAVSSWTGGAQIWGSPRHKPATDHDSADVVQTVVF